MLLKFFYTLRALKIPVSVHEWLALCYSLSLDLAHSSLDQFYYLARSILVKSEAHFDDYDQAFLICFRDQKWDSAKLRDEILDWLDKTVDGKRPEIPQVDPLTLEELRQKLMERLKEQAEEHHGGNYWIGTGGRSPFGHSGAHPSGIRVGGPGGGRMAVQIADERRFKNYRRDQALDTRQFQVALKRLRKLDYHGPADVLNLDESISETCKNAGEIELVFEPQRKNQTKLLLVMDVGGSMDIHAKLMDSLFSAAHALDHFKDFRHFYFHNCVYQNLFTDASQNQKIATEEWLKQFDSTYKVVFVGDACMNPYELYHAYGAIDYYDNHPTPGIDWLRRIREHFSQIVWLNPEPQPYWQHPTIRAVEKIFKMYPLTVDGLSQAVDFLRGKNR